MTYEQYQNWRDNPIIGEPFLSVIIPAYNEEIRIIPTIGAIASHVSSLGIPFELIVADDGSKDDTVLLVHELNMSNLQMLVADKNGGKGSAVQRGVSAARGECILFCDADNSTPIEEIDRLLNKVINEDYDIAIGSRAIDGAEETKKGILRRVMSGGLRWIVRNFIRISIEDTQCGFKLFRRDVAKQLHEAQTIMGFSFDLEILYLADKYGYRVAEVPVYWVDSPGSKVDTRKEAQRFLGSLIKIKANDIRGYYSVA